MGGVRQEVAATAGAHPSRPGPASNREPGPEDSSAHQIELAGVHVGRGVRPVIQPTTLDCLLLVV